jgi:FkbM family methyltransferase
MMRKMNERRGRLSRTITTFRRYGNPLHVLRKRLLGAPEDRMTAVDRQTGVRCEFPVAAFHMLSSIWYEHDYDIPRMPIREGDVVIDVGANHGFFACYAASKGARVYAFEPSPIVFQRLEQNIAANGFESRITARPWAISERTGEAQLLRTEKMGGGMSTIVPEFARGSGLPVVEQLTVPCYTLSDLLETFRLSTVRVCKIDAEGSEVAILTGVQAAHRTCLQSMVMEYHPEAYPLEQLLSVAVGWGTHQISFMDEKRFSGNIVRAVSTESLLHAD